MAEYLSPWEIAAYQGRNDQLTTQYQNTLASSAYQRARLGLRNQMNKDDANYSWDQQRAKLPGSYVARGLLNSGIYKGALGDYATRRLKSDARREFDYTDQLGQIDLGDQNAGNTYNTGLSGIAAEQAARRSELATQLRGLN